jgi:UDP-GlcNAc:undecaprenyl-phosphate GlcNAc-1-phosphate transferase
MREYVLTLLAAAAVTYLLTPLVRRFAIAIGAMHAARDRDVHVVPTPLLGGFAMYAGLAAGLLVASQLPPLNSVFAETNMAKGLLLAGGLVVVMGFVDDRWGMGVISKLAGQVAAGVILVWSNAEVTWLPTPGGATLSLTSNQQIAATILVVVVTINAVNFIDGLDGLAAGIAGIGAAAFFAYYYTLTHRLGLPDQAGPALASAVLAGICIGFLPHNYHPARIFMGDTGSMLIGLLLAYAPISSLASLDPGSLTAAANAARTVNRFGAILPLLLPAAILLIPYADLLMAVLRRTRAGMSPFAPDRKHLHHRMLDIGHSHRASVMILYLWAILFAGSVVWLSIVRTPLIVLVIITLAAMLALLLASMPRLRPWVKPAPAGVPANRKGAAAQGATAQGGPAKGGPANRAPAKGAAPSATAPPPAVPALPPGAHAPAPAESGPVRPAPAHHPHVRRADPAGTSRPGSPPWPSAPPTPQAAFHPAPPPGAALGAGRPLPRPAGRQEPSPPWPAGPEPSTPWPDSSLPGPESLPPWPESPPPWPESSPPRPGGPSGSSPLWPNGLPEPSSPRPAGPPEPSPPAQPAASSADAVRAAPAAVGRHRRRDHTS